MARTQRRTQTVALLGALLAGGKWALAGLPAFPGAEGFGADTPGGRGGQVRRGAYRTGYGGLQCPLASRIPNSCGGFVELSRFMGLLPHVGHGHDSIGRRPGPPLQGGLERTPERSV